MNKLVLTAVTILMFCGVSLSAQQDHYADALKLLEQAENCKTAEEFKQTMLDAAKLLQTAADNGNAEAMFQLANLYRNGWGVQQSDAQAVKLLEKAAEKNHGGALYNLGAYYSAHDKVKSADYFRRALEKGIPGAATRFGYCCLRGFGVEKDIQRAKAAFNIDAMRGMAVAQNQLGVLLFKENKFFNAEEWFQKAAAQDYAAASNNLGVLERIRGNHNKSLDHFRKAADKGYVPAMRNLALAYVFTGKDQKAYDQAREWAEKAVTKNDPAAHHILGMIHLLGYGVKKDAAKAFSFYLKGAESGYAMSAYQVAEMYRNGLGVTADKKKADEWMGKAVSLQKKQDAAIKSTLDVTK